MMSAVPICQAPGGIHIKWSAPISEQAPGPMATPAGHLIRMANPEGSADGIRLHGI